MAKDPLQKYRDKRSFSRTPEPAGKQPAEHPGRRSFVVQRHRARRLHYDLRFEIDGVLVSWAVPKGPTLDPSARRMAVHVEDHPIEYADFEGVIPAGEYGGGDVIVWDRGTWEPHDTDDPAAAVAARRAARRHVRREAARPARAGPPREGRTAAATRRSGCCCTSTTTTPSSGWDPEDHPRSVLSGRTNDEVAADPDRLLALRPAGCRGRRAAAWRTPVRRRRARGLDDLRPRRHVGGLRPQPQGHQPRQGAVPGRGRRQAGHQARAAPVLRRGRADRAAVPDRPGAEHAPLPGRCRRARASGRRHGPKHAPDWVTGWDNPDGRRGRDRDLRRGGRAGRPSCGRPTSARWSGTPGRR